MEHFIKIPISKRKQQMDALEVIIQNSYVNNIDGKTLDLLQAYL